MDSVSSEIFKQLFFNNKKISEVAELLGMTASKIKQIIFKIRKRMRDDFPEHKEILLQTF